MDEGARRGIDAGLDRVTIQEAARRLGVSGGGVRKRVTRRTPRHDKAPDGRAFVYLDGGVDGGVDEGVDDETNALIARLEDEVAYLREESMRNDEIIMQQTVIMPQLPAPPEEPPESSEGRGPPQTPTPPSEEAQRATQRLQGGGLRGWRRRILGW